MQRLHRFGILVAGLSVILLLTGGCGVTDDARPEPPTVTDDRTTTRSITGLDDPPPEPQEQLIFYATDRARFELTFGWYVMRFAWALGVLVLGRFLLRSARKTFAPPYQWRVTFGNWVLGIVVAGLALWAIYSCVRMHHVDRRLAIQYSGDRLRLGEDADLPLEVGTCLVTIPPHHVRGEMERPSPWKGDLFEDPYEHVVLRDVQSMEEGAFFDGVKERVGKDTAGDVFVFIHGYNVSFENAALRTAQIAYDLDFRGAPVLYSWPSQGVVTGYLADAANVGWTVPHLDRFLMALRKRTGAEKIHLIAHSMGNRALAAALQRIHLRGLGTEDGQAEEEPFRQIVLAAPDIDADTFREDIAPMIRPTAHRMTLYASTRDYALTASSSFHGEARAGEAGESLVVIEGIETVDVSRVSGSHSYIGDNGRVLDDLRETLHDQPRPIEFFKSVGDYGYWLLRALGEEPGDDD